MQFDIYQQKQPITEGQRVGPAIIRNPYWRANLVKVDRVTAKSAEEARDIAREWPEFATARGLDHFPVVEVVV